MAHPRALHSPSQYFDTLGANVKKFGPNFDCLTSNFDVYCQILIFKYSNIWCQQILGFFLRQKEPLMGSIYGLQGLWH